MGSIRTQQWPGDPDIVAARSGGIVARHGAAGERFVGMLRDSAATLFDLARRYRIEAEQEQTGWVQPVHSPGRIKIAERRVRQWSKFGAPVELLSREQVRDMLGSDAWYGGFWNRTGGHINPLALARGLARACLISAAASMRARRRKDMSVAAIAGW